MLRITKSEMEIMLEKGILRKKHGIIKDLVIVGKNRNKERKQRYVTDDIYYQLYPIEQKNATGTKGDNTN